MQGLAIYGINRIQTIGELRAAKDLHDKLEAIYRPYMDFDALTRSTDENIERLFA